MPRRRLFVALVLEEPDSLRVEGLQQACGHSWPLRVPPHITLVPPVNVNEERLGAALALVRRVAGSVKPVAVTLGAPESFLPRTPVLYASVDDPKGRVGDLQRRLQADPLAPPGSRSSHPFVPHVTLARRVDQPRVEAARLALAQLCLPLSFDRVTVLEQDDTRVWHPMAEAMLGRRAVVGTGGLALTIDRSRLVDPEMAAFLAAHGRRWAGWVGVAWAARRNEELVGLAVDSTVVVDPSANDLEVARHLRAALAAASDAAGIDPVD